MSSPLFPRSGRQAVFTAAGTPLSLATSPVEAPPPGMILVRVTCCTICGSDRHTWHGRRSTPLPGVLGHEIVGRIVALGEGAPRRDLRGQELRPGHRVSWTLAASCGYCFYCLRGLPQKCDSLFKYGHEALGSGPGWSGGFADYCLLRPGTGIVKVPDAVSDELAAPANCATATVMAAFRLAGEVRGATVLVMGAGTLGLTACAAASFLGAGRVILCDVDAGRLVGARAFGATAVATLPGLGAVVADATGGRGVDVSFEFTGATAAVGEAVERLRIGGTAMIAGTVLPVPAWGLDPERLVRRMWTIRGLHNYAPGDLLAAFDFLTAAQRVFPLAGLVRKRIPLERISEAFAGEPSGAGGRVAVVPGREDRGRGDGEATAV